MLGELEMPKRRLTIHTEPHGDLPKSAPRDAVALEFARKLQAEMVKRGWNQSDLARAATKHMPEGSINRDSISQYVNARNMPNPVRLDALAAALDVAKEDLLPARGVTARGAMASDMDLKDMGDGRVWLRVNQPLDWADAMEILAILRKSKEQEH